MLFLLLLALCASARASPEDGCATNEACIRFTLCGAPVTITEVELLDESTVNGTSGGTACEGHQSITMRFRPSNERTLSILLESSMASLKGVELSLNNVGLAFSAANQAESVAISGDAQSGSFSISSLVDKPFEGTLQLKMPGPSHKVFANLNVTTPSETWPLPGFAERLEAITPCDNKCREARASALSGSCSESDLNRACEGEGCEFHVTPTKVLCPSKLRVDMGGSSLFLKSWVVAADIACRDERWQWRTSATTGYSSLGGREVACSEHEPLRGTTALWWAIGFGIANLIIISIAVGVCCYLRKGKNAKQLNCLSVSVSRERETSLGALTASQRANLNSDGEPKTWKWPVLDSTRAVVKEDAPAAPPPPPKDTTAPPKDAPKDTTPLARDTAAASPVDKDAEKSKTIEGTSFSAKTINDSKKK